jgi:hypothetical protein
MTLRGIPTIKCPDNWPGYDLLAQPAQGRVPLKISVKARTFERGGDNFVSYDVTDDFDWLAIVLLPGDGQEQRRFFILPKDQADRLARRYSPNSKVADVREWRLDEVAAVLQEFGRQLLFVEDRKQRNAASGWCLNFERRCVICGRIGARCPPPSTSARAPSRRRDGNGRW